MGQAPSNHCWIIISQYLDELRNHFVDYKKLVILVDWEINIESQTMWDFTCGWSQCKFTQDITVCTVTTDIPKRMTLQTEVSVYE